MSNILTQVVTVKTMFDKKKYQRERRCNANGKQYFLDNIRQALTFGHRFVHHVEGFYHDDHVQ